MLRKRGLTTLAVENAKPGAERSEISDGRGLFLVVQPSGGKSWAYRHRFNGKPSKLTLGTFPQVSLAAARKLAAEARHKLEQGIDPSAEKRQIRETERDAAVDTVAQFVELYCKRKLRSWRQVERVLRVEVVPRWRGKTVHDIRRRDVHSLLDNIAAERPVMANRTFAYVRKFFAWCVERGILPVSPCAGVRMPAKETPRERVLADAEIAQFWRAVEAEPVGPYFKVLLLTGQRRSETASMRWSEIDERARVWTIPGIKTKNAKMHAVPLSRQAWEIIQDLPRIAGDNRVFATLPASRGYNACKKRLDSRMRLTQAWTAHDLRRTLATGLQRLGVRLEVTEAVLNHTSGSRSGIVSVYQRHTYADEKRAALQRWADYLDELVGDTKDPKIIQFGR
jgi:integrase